MTEILARPLSDLVRLAWADRAEPARAELVRTQIALAQAEYGRPRAAASDIVLLRRHAAAAIAQHGLRWAGPAALAAAAYRFERGFVEHLTLDARTFLDGAPLLARYPLVSVRLVDVHAVRPADLFGAPHLAGLASLDLSGARLGDDGVVALAASPWLASLGWLSLHDNHVGLRGAAALARSDRLPSLRYVAFGKNRVDLAPRPRALGFDDAPLRFDTTEAGQALAERYGPRPWLTGADADGLAWPPEPYDVLVAAGRYVPGT